jgi:hypothetical protein
MSIRTPLTGALHHVFVQWLLLCALLYAPLCACTDAASPEAQVRAAIAGMEAAAEARDASDVMEFVAPEFRSAEGQGVEDLQRYLLGYLLAHQSIHLLTRIEELEFPVDGEAHVRLSVGMAGTGAAAGGWELATDVQQLDLVLRRQADQWLVVYAERK